MPTLDRWPTPVPAPAPATAAAGVSQTPNHPYVHYADVVISTSSSESTDVSLTAGMLILYMVIVIASGIVVGVCLHYVFAVGLPFIKHKWQLYRTRRQLGLLLDNDPQNKFPLFQFDPAQVQGPSDAAAIVIQVDDQPQSSETTIDSPLHLQGGGGVVPIPVAAESSDTSNQTLLQRRRHRSSPLPVSSSSSMSSASDSDDPTADHQHFIHCPPALLRHHSAAAASAYSSSGSPPTSLSTSFAATSTRPSFTRSLSATTTSSLFSHLPNQLATASTSAASTRPQHATTTTTTVAGTSQVTCSICLDDYERGDKVRQLPCGHHFHDRCLRPWLEQSALQAPPTQPPPPPPQAEEMPVVQEANASSSPNTRRHRRNTLASTRADSMPSVAADASTRTPHHPLSRSRSLSAFLSSATLGRRHTHSTSTSTSPSDVHHRRWLSLRSRLRTSSSTINASGSSSLYMSYWQRHPISCPMCRESWSLVPTPKAAADQQVEPRATGHVQHVSAPDGSIAAVQRVRERARHVDRDLTPIGEQVGRRRGSSSLDGANDGDPDQDDDDDTMLDMDAIAQQHDDWMRQLRPLPLGDRVAGRGV